VIEMKGDSAIAVFGCVGADTAIEKTSVDAALALQRGIDDFNKNCDLYGVPSILASIGIASGTLLVGGIGPSYLEEYSALGNPIGDAKIQECLATTYGCKIVVCSRTLETVKDLYHVREVDIVSPKSGTKAVPVYEVMCEASSIQKNDMMSVRIH
jgi:class 3 adenylate cyclase